MNNVKIERLITLDKKIDIMLQVYGDIEYETVSEYKELFESMTSAEEQEFRTKQKNI